MLERLKDASVKMFLFADASRSRKQTQVHLRPNSKGTKNGQAWGEKSLAENENVDFGQLLKNWPFCY